MAKRRSKKKTTRKSTTRKTSPKKRTKKAPTRIDEPHQANSPHFPLKPGYLVTFRKGHVDSGMAQMTQSSGAMRVASSREVFDSDAVLDNDAIFFEGLGVAIVDVAPDQAMNLQNAAGGVIASVVREPIFYTCNSIDLNYLKGYRDAINGLYDKVSGDTQEGTEQLPTSATANFQDNATFTWGLQATNAASSPLSGQGVAIE